MWLFAWNFDVLLVVWGFLTCIFDRSRKASGDLEQWPFTVPKCILVPHDITGACLYHCTCDSVTAVHLFLIKCKVVREVIYSVIGHLQ